MVKRYDIEKGKCGTPNSISPENALINVRTPGGRTLITGDVSSQGKCGTPNSISPENALINVRTPNGRTLITGDVSLQGKCGT